MQRQTTAQLREMQTHASAQFQEVLGLLRPKPNAEASSSSDGPGRALAQPQDQSPYAKPHIDPLLPHLEETMDVIEYFSNLEDIFLAKRTPPESQFRFTLLALTAAQRLLVKENGASTYADLKEIVLKRYKSPNEEYHRTVALQALTQQGDDLEGYLRDFKLAVANIPVASLSDREKRTAFVRGLPPISIHSFHLWSSRRRLSLPDRVTPCVID